MILETPENVVSFLDKCAESIRVKADSEFEQIREFKKKVLKIDAPLMHWDVPFVSGIIKKQLFDLDRSQYMSYFSLGCCMEGLNLILNQLYE